jgi:hypothetical protein
MNVTATQSATAVCYSPATSSTPPTAAPGGDDTTVSTLGTLMGKLSDLSQSDPAKAKQVLADIATKLGQSSDPHLQQLADKFQQASQTGDVSSLQPHHKGGGGHHHHHATPSGQAASYQQTDGDQLASISGALGE